jgi:hypothetical protein
MLLGRPVQQATWCLVAEASAPIARLAVAAGPDVALDAADVVTAEQLLDPGPMGQRTGSSYASGRRALNLLAIGTLGRR